MVETEQGKWGVYQMQTEMLGFPSESRRDSNTSGEVVYELTSGFSTQPLSISASPHLVLIMDIKLIWGPPI